MAKLLIFGIIYRNQTLNVSIGHCGRFSDVLIGVISDI